MITATGSFVGNVTARSITGLAFQPDLVILKNTDSTFDTWFKTKDMPAAYSLPVRSDSAGDTNHITAINTDGFSVSTDGAVNNTGANINWIAIKDDGTGDFSTISFMADGTDDLLVFSAFQPTYTLMKSTFTVVGASKFKDQVSALANQASNVAVPNYQGTGDRPDLIYFGSDGMRVSNGSNSGGNLVNPNTYQTYGFVFKDSANIVSGTFTGTGVAGNAVNVGFQPILVLAEDYTKGQSFSAYAAESALGGYSQQWDGAKQTDKITALTSTGFTVGSDAYLNTSGNQIRYVAIKQNAGGGGGIVPGPDVAALTQKVPQGSVFSLA